MGSRKMVAKLATARHSYRLAGRGSHNFALQEKLLIPIWVSKAVSNRISLSCQSCQDFLDIKYGVAECMVCPLADFVRRLKE
jgi:hypothetical protein